MIAERPGTPLPAATSAPARLRVVLDSGRELSCALPVGGALVVGRDPHRADVVVTELGCAPVHLRLTRVTSNQWVAHDLAGHSGTLWASGVAGAQAAARALASTRAELRAVAPRFVAALTDRGLCRFPASGVTLLRARAQPVAADDLLVLPGAIVCLERGGTRAAAFEAADAGPLERATLDGLAATIGRWLVPVVAHVDLFEDAPRIPGRCAELDGPGFAALLRRLARRAPGRAGVVELAFHLGPDGHVAAYSAAVVEDAGEVCWVGQEVTRAGDLAASQARLAAWRAASGARA